LSDITSDMAYWKSVRGTGAPGGIFFRDQRISATHIEVTYGFQSLIHDYNEVVMVHAPSSLDFPLQKGMHRLTGTIGLLPSAWTGPKKSAGAYFEIWHVPPAGESKMLFRYLVDPAHDPTQRTALPFAVNLPYPSAGLLRLVTRPQHPQDNSFNYTYWGPLTAEEFTATITGTDPALRSVQAETTFGFADMEEANQPVTFAHAPSLLAFPLTPGLHRLSGKIGLLASAYTGPDATDGGRFVIEAEDATGRRTVLWQRELNPRDVPADRGFIPFTVDLPDPAAGRLILRTEARPGWKLSRAWTFWHALQIDR
jgi:hypothetical protein